MLGCSCACPDDTVSGNVIAETLGYVTGYSEEQICLYGSILVNG